VQGLDVQDPHALRAAAESAVASFGSLDVLVANAGISDQSAITTGEPDRWREVVNTNLLGTIYAARAVVPAMVAQVLEQVGVQPARLTLEITESGLFTDPATVARAVRELRGLGCNLAIDDFGTGYSSLAYLERFPVDSVKIDQAFVAGLDRPDGSSHGLVAAIVAMARALGLTTVAEGIEIEEGERKEVVEIEK